MSTQDREPFELLPGFHISPEFIEEGKKIRRVKPRHKFAPYTKKERNERRKTIFHLHFELGYPATRIAEETGIHRNTINSDLNYIYSEMAKQKSEADYMANIWVQVVRLENQRTRMLGYLDHEKDLNKKLKIEQMIAGIDFKLAALYLKIEYGNEKFTDAVFKKLNQYAKEKKLDFRYTSLFEAVRISVRTRRRWDKMSREMDGREK